MDLRTIQEARALIKQYVCPSRLVPAPSLSTLSGAEVYLKLESEGPTSAFKPRGAIYSLSERLDRGPLKGVVTASSGNHGAAVAFAARVLDCSATIFLPQNPNPIKRHRIVQQGAKIVECGKFLEESRQAAAKYAAEHELYNIIDGETEGLTIGAGTIGCEILEQLPRVHEIIVPVGDSSLIRGLAFAVKQQKPDVRIIGVQAERAPAYYRSWLERRPMSTDFSDTIADGLATRHASPTNVRDLLELVDDMKLVADQQMLKAMWQLLAGEGVFSEPAGAASTAALLDRGNVHAGKVVVLLVTGANAPPSILKQAFQLSPQ